MLVFVTGASGVIGRRTVARLVAAGHTVTGVSRSAEKDALLVSLGATPVRVSLFDAAGLRTAISGHDAVLNLATHIPPIAKIAVPSAWAENQRIRSEASGFLVDAAIAAGVTVFVQESLAFLYGEHGDAWIDAASTPWTSVTSTRDAVAIAEENLARFTAQGGRGVVLRFGRFYAADSDQTEQTLAMARRGVLADVGRGAAYVPVIDVDDAAAAAVAALAAPAGIYDIVDDDPMTREEQADALARAVGRRRLWRAPSWSTPKSAVYLGNSQRVSNVRYREATGWRPTSPSMREGYPKLLRALHMEPALRGRVRLMLWILVFSAFGVGVQAAFFPRSFYDDFPIGRGWVAMDGRYNEHLIRDVGALNLALLVLTIGAIYVGSRAIAKIAAASWLVYSVPHWVYHLRHLSMPMTGAEKAAVLVSLAVPVIASVVILFDRRRPAPVVVDLRTAEERTASLTPMSVRR